MPASVQAKSVALIGARGYTGAELIRLIAGHPHVTLSLASSRELAGQRVREQVPEFAGDLRYEDVGPQALAERDFDVVILALPNGASRPYVEAIEGRSEPRPSGSGFAPGSDRDHKDGNRSLTVAAQTVIIDISADHRFDDAWAYGLPEHFREGIRGAHRIANPGCYATAMQIAIRPMLDLLDGPPQAFGISGFSGAGTTPAERNDPNRLRDNILPYTLIGHTHERETSRHLNHPICFFPHVASFFRGLSMTISMKLREPQSVDELCQRYHAAYDDEPLIRFRTEVPEIREVIDQHICIIGGLTVDETGTRMVVVSVLDNLLKGAATQAMQNLTLALGFDEWTGIDMGETAQPREIDKAPAPSK